jgi:uncharacterized RmlC-like cupin family protein
MKTNLVRILMLSAMALLAVSPTAFAQRQLGKKKGPTSKLYIAESVGDTQIQTGDKIYTARQATAFDAPGTVIETAENSRIAFVYSNGMGMSIGGNSHLEINRFDQEPFTPNRNAGADTTVEPSISLSDIHLTRGTMGISTSQFVSGSSLLCSTPLATINVRGGRISIETTATETIIDLLEGDATVRTGDRDNGGYVLHPGERIIIRLVSPSQPYFVSVIQTPSEALLAVSERVSLASNARKTVTFEVIEQKSAQGLDGPPVESAAAGTPSTGSPFAGGGDTEVIVAKPTVPQNPPVNIVISPDRLPGG